MCSLVCILNADRLAWMQAEHLAHMHATLYWNMHLPVYASRVSAPAQTDAAGPLGGRPALHAVLYLALRASAAPPARPQAARQQHDPHSSTPDLPTSCRGCLPSQAAA